LAAGGLAFLCIGCLLSLLRPRGSARASLPLAQRLVFGRHSRLIALALPLAAGLLALCFVPGAALMLRAPLGGGGGPKLTSIFPHDKHREVPCVQCHHNFTDHTGEGSCYDCHRSSRVDLKAGLEARFHDFCLGCHRDPPPAARDHGPATGCATCHL
ncbi:MAG: cytochrome c3 family protein, partial [Gammaproteobacteria bacterium]|nr:cytochrome c3 family protein [Gammaproteobacteria bacterium]